jgi:endo-1,4-beta-xylanase
MPPENTPRPAATATPAAVALLPVDPLAAFRLGGRSAADARVERVAVAGMPFSHALRVRTARRPERTYDIQLSARITAPVAKGDVLLAAFFVRTIDSTDETGEARTTFIFEQASEPYTKSIMLPLSVGKEWQRIDYPFQAVDRYGPGQAQVNFQLGYAPQVIEIGGIAVLNYGKHVKLQDLPRTRFSYAGREAGAIWRAAALQRLEALRKADLVISVQDAQGRPVPGAAVEVRLRRHAFGFGSAVDATTLLSQTADGQQYRETVQRLFSKAVLENDLKWPWWEDPARRARTLQAIDWLRGQGIAVRGHNLVWPGWRNLPRSLHDLRADPEALRRRVYEHILDEAGALRGKIADWDVINEPYMNRDLMDILGDEVMVEWFQAARQADPESRLFLNEATAPGTGERQEHFERTIRFLLEHGAPLDGIGFQCHFGLTVTAPEQLLRSLDRFARFGLPIQVTEFDIDTTDEELQADYTRDFLIAMFSHPAIDAILLWGFWEGRHWRPNAALFRRDWTVKPNGQAWIDLVTRRWWTEAQGRTNQAGLYSTRGFLGEYEVTVTTGTTSKTVTASLIAGGPSVVVKLD